MVVSDRLSLCRRSWICLRCACGALLALPAVASATLALFLPAFFLLLLVRSNTANPPLLAFLSPLLHSLFLSTVELCFFKKNKNRRLSYSSGAGRVGRHQVCGARGEDQSGDQAEAPPAHGKKEDNPSSFSSLSSAVQGLSLSHKRLISGDL